MKETGHLKNRTKSIQIFNIWYRWHFKSVSEDELITYSLKWYKNKWLVIQGKKKKTNSLPHSLYQNNLDIYMEKIKPLNIKLKISTNIFIISYRKYDTKYRNSKKHLIILLNKNVHIQDDDEGKSQHGNYVVEV